MTTPTHSGRDWPLLPLRRGVILPGRLTSLPVGREKSRALTRSLNRDEEVLLAVQHDSKVLDPVLADLHPVAILARVKDKVDRGRRGQILVVEGIQRVELTELTAHTPFWRARCEPASDTDANGEEARALATALVARLQELGVDKALLAALPGASPARVADIVGGWLEVPSASKVELLRERSVPARLRRVAELVSEARASAELKSRVDSEVRKQLSKHQKEQLLRQQLKAIQKELGELDGDDEDPLDALEATLEEIIPEEHQKTVQREMKRLRNLNPQAPEANVVRTWLETLAELPWQERAEAPVDLQAVSDHLESDHFGLDDVKRRILEHMAVLKLAPEARGTTLCLVGPPGVGKTSLAQSVADATGRPLVRVSLGGVRDEAEIRGHRRTYVGAMAGRVMSAIRKSEVKNPVVVLDEIDKVGVSNWAGDPQAALLELLDPEQNDRFQDHYVDLPFDLSEVLFIATANQLGPISAPLRDRLEIIEVTGYTDEEKVQIALRHLWPKQLDRHGLEDIEIEEAQMLQIVRDYTREAGVRKLEQQLKKLLRAVALDVARDNQGAAALDEKRVREVLGKPRFLQQLAERERPAGVAAGLAWTPVGGDVLYVETTKMPGKGKLEITGQLGDVMNESARAALAYIRSHAAELGVDSDVFETQDLHLHVPAGAVQKDGPSAGVTIFTAFASLLSGRKIRPDTAMTGEATLRGRVLPVGGIDAKVLAARRAGFDRVVLPKKNAVDLDDVPESVRETMEFVLVDSMDEVLEAALEPMPVPPTGGDGDSVTHLAT
ncbi:MAG: endopeptidase La [Deltaproteobacteria bacterium]|nr:endopeptidase La [Deltaproteobacteria bacterium]